MRMDRENRAKQFMPFDALKGFREALAEKERIVVPKRVLPETWENELEWKLRQLQKRDMVRAEYFQRGEYVCITGMVSEMDKENKVLKVVNTKIAFEDIVDLQGPRFEG